MESMKRERSMSIGSTRSMEEYFKRKGEGRRIVWKGRKKLLKGVS